MRHVAIPVGRAFPDAHRGEVRRLQRGDVPLVDAVIRDAVEPDLAVRPRLHAGPFDAVIEVLGLARREVIDVAGRAAGAARIHAHARIAVRHPFLRVHHLPALIEVRGSRCDVGMLFHHALPRARIAVLEREAFGVGAVGEDDRMPVLLDGPEHVGAQHEAVVHRDRHVPVDAHAVAGFTALGHDSSLSLNSDRLPPPHSPSKTGVNALSPAEGWGGVHTVQQCERAPSPTLPRKRGRGPTARAAPYSLTA